MQLADYVRTIARGWLVIVSCVLLGLLGAVAVTLTTTPQYRSQSSVFVSIATSGASSAELGQSFTSAESRVPSYVAVASTGRVLQPVIDSLGLKMTVEQLAKEVQPVSVTGTVLITLIATDSDAQRSADIANATATSLQQYVLQQLEVPTSGGTSGVSLQIIETATPPSSPISPDRTVNILLGVLSGLIIGIGAILLRSLGDTRIYSVRDIARVTDVPVIDSIGLDKRLPKAPLPVVTNPGWAVSEAFRSLRTRLLFGAATIGQTILVTSPLPREGKTTVATNLAAALAEAGHTVVIVDADLKNPKVAAFFGTSTSGPGVSSILLGRHELPADLPRARRGGAAVLWSGPTESNASTILGTVGMDALLTELGKRYDYVVIDSPPLLESTDAAVLSKLVSSVLLVVGTGKTSRSDLTSALESLDAMQAPVTGLVVTLKRVRGARDDDESEADRAKAADHLSAATDSRRG